MFNVLCFAGTEDNFAKLDSGVASPFGEGYDYGSAMHYSTTAFSADKKHQTIVPIVR